MSNEEWTKEKQRRIDEGDYAYLQEVKDKDGEVVDTYPVQERGKSVPREKDGVVIKYGHNHIEPGDSRNPKKWAICGAKKHDKSKGIYCLHFAGFRTNHFGVGRCYLHGGKTGRLRPTSKDGRYSDVWLGRMKEFHEKVRGAADSPMDMLPELEAQRTLMVLALSALGRELGTEENPLGIAENLLGSLPYSTEETEEIAREMWEQGLLEDPSLDHFFPSTMPTHEKVALTWSMLNGLLGSADKISSIKSRDALTKTDVKWLQVTLKEAIDKFILDDDTKRAFINFIAERIP